MTPLANNIEVQTINHLGIIAGIITDQPTLRWIFQCFQGIHVVVFNGLKQIVNLTESRQHTINNFPEGCQKYYILSG